VRRETRRMTEISAPPRLLTLPRAARRWPELGHPSTLYRRWRAGELPPGSVVVLGGRPYVRVAVVEAWLDGRDAASKLSDEGPA
jgi:hypothetical protein